MHDGISTDQVAALASGLSNWEGDGKEKSLTGPWRTAAGLNGERERDSGWSNSLQRQL